MHFILRKYLTAAPSDNDICLLHALLAEVEGPIKRWTVVIDQLSGRNLGPDCGQKGGDGGEVRDRGLDPQQVRPVLQTRLHGLG